MLIYDPKTTAFVKRRLIELSSPDRIMRSPELTGRPHFCWGVNLRIGWAGRSFPWEADPVSYTVRPLLVEIMFRLVGT
ncbi:hypothetical protein PghCCS26_62070 [Paenibacillus glycanilyticus]|uniref:Uncharacterized protein n=1 Tax=Paenibacillus glycanilyticus TaxID=126569 RepID=A0ABQ6NVE7_9BACL|nr:hypothetical protein PghCCS26_62070 [Paenibacillus glycanilyticus]